MNTTVSRQPGEVADISTANATTPLRVAQVIGRLGGGGAQQLAYNLASALSGRAEQSYAVAIKSAENRDADSASISVHGLAANNGVWSKLRAAWRLRKLVQRERISVVHVHGAGTLPFCVLALMGLRRRPRLCFTWHDSEGIPDGKGFGHRLTRWAMTHCAKIWGSSRNVAERLSKACPAAPRAIAFRNGVPEVPATSGLNAARPTIVWAARFVPIKDPEIAVRAAARLKAEGLSFRLILAGAPLPHLQFRFDEVKAHVQREGLEDVIEMPGWVKDMPALLQSAAIGLQTSHTEGLSMTLLEQMMAGLAIVATDVGDTAEAVLDEQTGLLIPPRDEDALTEALRRLITNPQLRQQFGAAARRRALEEFSLDAMAKRAADAYLDLLEPDA